MNPFKQIGITIIILVLAAGGYWGWSEYKTALEVQPQAKQDRQARIVDVEVATPVFRQVSTILEAVGEIRAHRAVNIVPLASGRIKDIFFKAGEEIKKNEIIVRLNSELESANVSEARAKYKDATSALKRSKNLRSASGISDATIERQLAQVQIAEAALVRAQKHLNNRVLRAPFNGHIGFSNFEIGAFVKQGEIIATLDDLSFVRVVFSLPEMFFGKLQVDSQFKLQAAAFGDRLFNGTIISWDTRVDNLSRSFEVRGLVLDAGRTLPPGMFANLKIPLEETRSITIPEEAVILENSLPFVFTLQRLGESDSITVSRQAVALGRRSLGFIEVTQGIDIEDSVVVRGTQKVRDGSRVNVKTEKRN